MHTSDLKQLNIINRDDVRKKALLRSRLKQYPHDLEAYYQRKKVCLPKQEDTTCSICLEPYVKTATTFCGHAFCERCIFESTLRKPQCPICRTNLKNCQLKFSDLLDQVITQQLNAQEQEQYKARYEQHEIWNKSRRVQSIEEGDLLDVLDTEYQLLNEKRNIWCVAKVMMVKEIGNKKAILIHYLGWNKIYDEIISVHSPRLAPKGFYTDRKGIKLYEHKDLPHYQINGQTEVTYSYVVVENGEQTSAFPHLENILNLLLSQRMQHNQEDENTRQLQIVAPLDQSQQNNPPE